MAKHCEIVIPEFGCRLKTALKNKHMSQRELAKRIDVSKDAINKYCNDYFYPNIGILKQICDVLDVSADYLLELKEGGK